MNKKILLIMIGTSILHTNTVTACPRWTLTWNTQPSTNQTAGLSSPTPVLDGQACSVATTLIKGYEDAACTTEIAAGLITGGRDNNGLTGGKYTYPGITFVTAGTYYLMGSNANDNPTTCIGPITVTHGTPTKIELTNEPASTGTVNVALSTQPRVSLKDVYGNLADSVSTGSVTLTAFSDAACTVAETYGTITNGTADFAAGVASFSDLKFSKIGTTYFKASSGAYNTDCSIAVTFSAGSASDVVSCSTLAGYTVVTGSARATGGSSCNSNEMLFYSTVDKRSAAMCVQIDCGADSRICLSENNSTSGGQNIQHYCAYP